MLIPHRQGTTQIEMQKEGLRFRAAHGRIMASQEIDYLITCNTRLTDFPDTVN